MRASVDTHRLNQSGIHVASYVTKLIPKKRLEQKLHEAVKMARARLAAGGRNFNRRGAEARS